MVLVQAAAARLAAISDLMLDASAGSWRDYVISSGQQSSARDRGNLSVGTSEVRDNRSVWLLVEELK